MSDSLCCLRLHYERKEKEYEVHSVSKFEKYNRHRSFL